MCIRSILRWPLQNAFHLLGHFSRFVWSFLFSHLLGSSLASCLIRFFIWAHIFPDSLDPLAWPDFAWPWTFEALLWDAWLNSRHSSIGERDNQIAESLLLPQMANKINKCVVIDRQNHRLHSPFSITQNDKAQQQLLKLAITFGINQWKKKYRNFILFFFNSPNRYECCVTHELTLFPSCFLCSVHCGSCFKYTATRADAFNSSSHFDFYVSFKLTDRTRRTCIRVYEANYHSHHHI